jgi:SAM-dependent methyltransferase
MIGGGAGAWPPAEYGDAIAAFYDDWYPAEALSTDEAVNFLAMHAGDGPVLELGIGTGRVALPLADRGLTVHGVDASPAMVERLRAKPGGDRLEVVIGDLADAASLGGTFSLIYIVFNTFFGLPSQEAQVACFANVAAALHPGGAFVMEAFVPDVGRFDRGQRVHVDRFDGETTRMTASIHDPLTQTVRSRHLLIGADGRVRTFPVDIRYAWPAELNLMARMAGLDIAERYADWTRQPFTSSSTTHVSVWRRPG